MIISSDGHATARMEDYAPYLPSKHQDEFRTFLAAYREKGFQTLNPQNLRRLFDDEIVDEWLDQIAGKGRLEGQVDPVQRIAELDRGGVSGEVIFPDFGLPFEMYPPTAAHKLGFSRTEEQVDIGNRAYNRWLVDFMAIAPERFAGLALVSFADVDAAVTEIRWAKEAGLKGVILPAFSESAPVFNPEYDPIWTTLEELEMPANSHTGISSTTTNPPVQTAGLANQSCGTPIQGADFFYYTRRILNHMIWGGVLERHPRLQIVFTEQGSGWVIGDLANMDYSYEGSYLKRDLRAVVKHRPSEYFARQCHLGSSIFSRAEIQARHRIGVDKINLGMDYPHHEGTWSYGTLNYLRATLGASDVPPSEAELMLGGNAAKLWGFDLDVMRPIAERMGWPMDDILQPPTEDLFPRGDVNKPLGASAL